MISVQLHNYKIIENTSLGLMFFAAHRLCFSGLDKGEYMTGTMIKKDFARNKAINIIQWFFIILSAFLMASGAMVINKSFASINKLFAIARPPHFMQMHTGDINQAEIESFAKSLDYVTQWQISEMLNMDGASIGFVKARGDITERINLSDSMMDNGFVTQNKHFDYLLNLNNEIISISDGEIAVPVKYMRSYGLELGDRVIISEDNLYMEFVITDFVRDAQMASSLASSTRFMVSVSDYIRLKDNIGRLEYLIEFMLTGTDMIDSFSREYRKAGLPDNGTAVTYPLFVMVNALGEGIKAIIFVLVSLLLIFISVINLRFTILTGIEDDIKEIGTLKALGISHKEIQKLYMTKYKILSLSGCCLACLAAILCSGLFLADMELNYGKQELSLLDLVIPLVAVALVHLIIMYFCRRIFKRIRNITVVQALIAQDASGRKIRKKKAFGLKLLRIERNTAIPMNLFLGIRELIINSGAWLLLLLVYALAICIMNIPANLNNTLRSPGFAAYMGSSVSDIRIDLQLVDDINRKHDEIIRRLIADEEIKGFSDYAMCRYKMLAEDRVEEILIECGDYTDFDISFLEGRAPIKQGEIALSVMNARKLSLGLGDRIRLMLENEEESLQVSGIYQDVTNGGYTAKMIYPYNGKDVVKYTYFIDLKEGIPVEDKADEYAKVFSFAKVIPMEDFLEQTFDIVLEPLSQVAFVANIVAVFISLLITVLFLKLNITRSCSQIANMKAMGFSNMDIRLQYLFKTGITTLAGILLGIILSDNLGEAMLGGLISAAGFGLSIIDFTIQPVQVFLLHPFMISCTAILAAWDCSKVVRQFNIVNLIRE